MAAALSFHLCGIVTFKWNPCLIITARVSQGRRRAHLTFVLLVKNWSEQILPQREPHRRQTAAEISAAAPKCERRLMVSTQKQHTPLMWETLWRKSFCTEVFWWQKQSTSGTFRVLLVIKCNCTKFQLSALDFPLSLSDFKLFSKESLPLQRLHRYLTDAAQIIDEQTGFISILVSLNLQLPWQPLLSES